ncbi:hypothetical protein GCM10007368_05760 [Isoptericola cucumis]|uniref:Uncharacterized protein n=1 Tax=Isoptericola cucumis TaxID=1776856 RepID=A0ABQ2B135_9MICO|nr:hypothetical protein GCM10007368_05760 [Isoptericola cucumis]
MRHEPSPQELTDFDAVPEGDQQGAERAVLVAGAVGVGVGVGVVAPQVWADYPWMAWWDSSIWLGMIFVVPPVAAIVGAMRAHWLLPGSVLWPATVLVIVIAFCTPVAAMWGGGPGASAGAFLMIVGLVLWDDRPRRWQLVGWGFLVSCLSLVGTTGLIAHVVPDGWWSPAASGLNLIALAFLVHRAVRTRGVRWRCPARWAASR